MAGEEKAVGNKQQSQKKLIGNSDKRLADARKVWIADDETTVCGVYGPGTTMSVSANWSTPFEGMTPGAKFDVLAGLTQAYTGMTLVNELNSKLVWKGNDSTQFQVELMLYALQDPDKEVMQPLRALEYMIAPDVKGFFGLGGQISKAIQINIGNRIIYQYLVMDNMSAPYDKEMDSQGRFVRCTVSLSFKTMTMVSKEMLRKGYGIKSDYQYSEHTDSNQK